MYNFAKGNDFDTNFNRRADATPVVTADNGTHYAQTAFGKLLSLVRHYEHSLTIRIVAEKEKQADQRFENGVVGDCPFDLVNTPIVSFIGFNY
jgi:hypothetical protein